MAAEFSSGCHFSLGRIVPERIAIISDLHSNLEALVAVLKDIERRRVTKIYCLGDLVGYGPNPNEVLDLARRNFELVIQGNHDHAVSYKIPKLFKEQAARGVYWTRKRVKPRPSRFAQQQKIRWDFLKRLPLTQEHGVWLMAHGTPASNLEYVYEDFEAYQVFERHMKSHRVCFLGHTHLPGIFLQDRDGSVHEVEIEEGMRYKLGAERALVNVGSVGQPRDGDPRSCWVLARSDGTFSFNRVSYEIEKTADKIYRSGLDPEFGERLFDGE